MNHKDYELVEEEFASILITAGILIQDPTEEELVAQLQKALDSELPISIDVFKRVEAKLAEDEHYELANVVKTFLDYNSTSKKDV